VKSERFLQAVSSMGTASLVYAEYLRILRETFPEDRNDPDGGAGAWIGMLTELRTAKKIRFATGNDVHHGRYRFPGSITLIRPRDKSFVRPVVEWDSRLAGLGAKASKASLPDLLKMNAYLQTMKVAQIPHAPINARSLEIFGDEKRLRSKVRNFDTGEIYPTLSLADLKCYVPIDRYLNYTFFDVPKTLGLIVENSETFHVLKRRNEESGSYRTVVFGRGKEILYAYRSLPEIALETGVTAFEYFGDIDIPGFDMPLEIMRRLSECSGPPILPAVGLYRECMARGKVAATDYSEQYDSMKSWQQRRSEASAWLKDEELFHQIDEVLGNSRRIAQEWVY
jgi:Uncharacterized protein conserved in bacteria C-term(DUF2220).